MEARACPVCCTWQTTISKYGRDHWHLAKCLACNFLFLPNPPAYEALEDEIAWEKTFEQEKLRRRQKNPLLYFLSTQLKVLRKKMKRDKVSAIASSFALSGEYLDIGCSSGEKMLRLCDKAAGKFKVVPFGIEISKVLAGQAQSNFAKLGGGCVQASAIDGLKQMQPHRFSCILMISFLEHEANPAELLQQAARVLKTSGIIIIKVPNFNSINRYWRQNEWCGFRYPDHVNYYSPASLITSIKQSNLNIKRMTWLDKSPFSDNMYLIATK